MPLSYRNLINGNKIQDVLGSIGDGKFDPMKNIPRNPKYVKGYESETFWESVFGGQLNSKDNPEMQSRFGQLFGFENKELDPYDPYTISGAKKEIWWKDGDGDPMVGRVLFPKIDEDVNTFRNILFNDFNNDPYEQYEDPLILGFKVGFNPNSPFFNGSTVGDDSSTSPFNSIRYFFDKYGFGDSSIDDIATRYTWYQEFKKKLFTIFEKQITEGQPVYNKPYYINKISGLNKLNKKIIKYGEDKLTITLNEDVRMIAWYLSELYNNLVYSYKNKRWMIPENLLRFDMNIQISDMRNFTFPTGKYQPELREDQNKLFKYELSPKSTIMFTLHDCSFNFFNSYNFADEITQAGYGASMPTQSELQFDIIYKSVTRWSTFPFLGDDKYGMEVDPWKNTIESNYFKELEIEKSKSTSPEPKGYWNDKLSSVSQTVANAGLNYLDNLETKLREERGKFVESSLNEFRNWTNINKIEPDNVYSPEFNNRLSLKNAGKTLASDLLNDLESETRNITNF